ncbi:EF2563 family selenium-dependent molybdenum hydroxylase system protein [Synergistaceae bacterium OttesenSCG-928-I11]|nr:EF2563 family selenium-dependent molybdenum hydroxylase system protein [Synergistaceae bacterium OttesenSCG-928-I11]
MSDSFFKADSETVVVRGGGDLATGVIYRLWRSGYRVLSLETAKPLVVRRTVSVAQAVFDGHCMVEDMLAHRIESLDAFDSSKGVSVLVDPDGESIDAVRPVLLVDAIMAKCNLGTHMGMAPLVVGIGPGFTAGVDVHCVVETKRGHYLGRLITEGSAIPNTGVPGMEMGYTTERLLRAPCDGFVSPSCEIGTHVEKGDIVAFVGDLPVRSQIAGTLRGMIHPSVYATRGLKIGDVDPRDEYAHCFSITDKALAIAGGVLEALAIFTMARREAKTLYERQV